MTIRLEGSGINPHWNIHRSLEMLQGLQTAALRLIQDLDKHIAQRDSGGGKHPEMMGNAVAAVVLTSYSTEIVLKTLHAQVNPHKRPPQGHYLLDLYDKLDPHSKSRAQELLDRLPPIGTLEWIGQSPDLRELV